MRRFLLLGFALVALSPASRVLGQTPAELAQTARFVEGFQTPQGSFAPSPGGTPTLGATSSSLRILGFVGGTLENVPGCIEFVKKCRDATSGGFAQTPGGKTDVATTAIGLMALAELKAANDEITQGAIKYFSMNVKSFEEIRIAVAGLEAVKSQSPDFPRWIKQVEADRNSDGTWGSGSGQARATGSAAVAMLRLGVDLDKKPAVIAALRGGQRPDGGWSDGDQPSDLGSSYRIMRGFFMFKEKPDLDRLLSFLAAHRQSDGGYSASVGKPSDLGSTYMATIMIRWARLLRGEPALVETAAFVPLFNGRDLEGWQGDANLWSARDGMLVGKSPGLNHNDFLATEASYGDFILKFSFRLTGEDSSNSGVQFRSVRIPGHEMSGYQADIGQGFWGCLYDESRRNKVLVQASEKAAAAVRKNEWNHYLIRVMGDHITLTLNDVLSVDYHEPDANIARDGRIALQIHAGGPMEIAFKDIYIQPLPRPTEDTAATPGFHLRTVKTSAGDRKYTVFIPSGYDGQQEFPAALFLHGSGERGTDGVTSAQIGLGAVINGRPKDFPLIVVFPQAEQSWNADTPDAEGALAALNDVLANFKVDRTRVILTGLSMGGHGSWEIGATHPELFAGVVPICGAAAPERATALKKIPVWTFVGDRDSDRTVLGLRALNDVLRENGASPRATEYRGVGHNSWDRAYSDPELLKWILARKRP